MNRICNICNKNLDRNNYLKDRTVCESCFNRNRRKNNKKTIIEKEIGTSPQRPKIDNINDKNTNTIVSTYENHDNVVIGPRNVAKTYYMLKILKKRGNKRSI